MKHSMLYILLLSLSLTCCLKEPDKGSIFIEKAVVSELPVLYDGCNLKYGSKVVIHNQATLDSVFSTALIHQIPVLQNIDFTMYDVLVAADSYARGIYKLEHHLIQNSGSIYSYKLYVYYDLTLPAGYFFYGIIIDKLPSGAHVIFNVEKLN